MLQSMSYVEALPELNASPGFLLLTHSFLPINLLVAAFRAAVLAKEADLTLQSTLEKLPTTTKWDENV